MKAKQLRTRLIAAALTLVMLIGALAGTTFAWFTDNVTSAGNKIQTGTLQMDLLHKVDTDWVSLKQNADHKVFDYDKWEPGYTRVETLQVTNLGSLALQYRLSLTVAEGTAVLGENGEDLANVIEVYVIYGQRSNETSFADIAAENSGWVRKGTLSEVIAAPATFLGGELLPTGETLPDGAALTTTVGSQFLTIALHMQETAGNEYQALAVGDIYVNLYAIQWSFEQDSFGADYDALAPWPVLNPGQSFTASTTVTPNVEGKVDADTTVGDPTGDIYANVPAGVQMADGANALTLNVSALKETASNVTATHRSEVVRSVDVHIDGVATGNTVPMVITLNGILPTGLNSNNVKLYHVENGETVAMTLVSNPTNHNEFSYDPLTGNVVLSIASFSEIVAYGDTDAAWDGTVATEFAGGKGTEAEPYLIANAAQLAYFRNEVDGGRNFEGEFVKLTADINLNKINFDPIGWGYVNSSWNRDGKEGLVFRGTFDGGNNTIFGLYQDGWDLETETGTDYTYTNCGGGLFAAAYNATFKNLKINGANIRYECVEIGVLVGLAQGGCTFENINIAGCKIANYQRPAGGVVGEVSPAIENGEAVENTHVFKNIYVDSNTVVGSLWGDFDAPVGGVIGAYWDDAGKTSVEMDKVTVACRLDVYNDVTSTYQWYAYRRAGMLIGNTDQASGHTATATYLKCTDVVVCYGEWANYQYCEFNEANPNWPWVRVQPGENCSGYSNPRWGRPIDPLTGNPVTDSVHAHGSDEEGHMLLIEFHQLYGGGQGVYGAETHDGVTEGQIYTVTYMDRDQILHVDYVPSNIAYGEDSIWPISNVVAANGDKASYWVDDNSKQFKGFDAGRTANATVYPKWPNEYTIRCLDTKGNPVYYNFVIDDKATDDQYQEIANDINALLVNIQNEVDAGEKVMTIVWKLVDYDDDDTNDVIYQTVKSSDIRNFVEKQGMDFVLEATPQLKETSISLKKHYDPTTGELVAYHVVDVNASDENKYVTIPAYIGNIPVEVIADGAFGDFDNLTVVEIPVTMKEIGEDAFASKETNLIGILKYEQITILYAGTYEQWQLIDKHENWDRYLGKGSQIYFLADGTYSEETASNGTWSAKDREWSAPQAGTYTG